MTEISARAYLRPMTITYVCTSCISNVHTACECWSFKHVYDSIFFGSVSVSVFLQDLRD